MMPVFGTVWRGNGAAGLASAGATDRAESL